MRRNILLAILAVICLGSCINQNEEMAKKSGQEIFFTETTHDYGEIAIDSDGLYKFAFKNLNDEDIVVNKVRSTCGCTIPSWDKNPIGPGMTGEIQVKYNTALAGSFMKTIYVYSSASNSPVKLVIKGKVIEGEE